MKPDGYTILEVLVSDGQWTVWGRLRDDPNAYASWQRGPTFAAANHELAISLQNMVDHNARLAEKGRCDLPACGHRP